MLQCHNVIASLSSLIFSLEPDIRSAVSPRIAYLMCQGWTIWLIAKVDKEISVQLYEPPFSVSTSTQIRKDPDLKFVKLVIGPNMLEEMTIICMLAVQQLDCSM